MAAATTMAIIAGSAALAGSGAQIAQGVSNTNKANRALGDVVVPDFNNPYENTAINTTGANLLLEENHRATASAIDAARQGGSRAVFSSLPRILAFSNETSQKAKADIDNQIQNRDLRIANYEAKINDVEENRYQNELAGIGNLMNTGNQQMWNGIDGAITSIGSIGRATSTPANGAATN